MECFKTGMAVWGSIDDTEGKRSGQALRVMVAQFHFRFCAMTTLNDPMQRFTDFREKHAKYWVKNDEGKWGLSIAKMYADGMTKVKGVVFSTDLQMKPKPIIQEDTSKLSGTLSLADLNEHRVANGLKTTLSQIDFDTLVKRTEGSFTNFETDATMNYRRNLYFWDMSEIISPKGSEAQNPVASPKLERSDIAERV